MATNSVLSDLGRVDNLNDPEPIMNRKEVILGIIISFLTISVFGATGRLYIRLRITRNLGMDDLFVFLSMVSNIAAATSLFILTSNGGLGHHFILLGADGMKRFLKIFYIANALYTMSTAFIKLALLFQYLRILERGTKLRTLTILSIVIVSLWGTAFTVLAWIPCLPIYAFWDLTVPDASVTRYAFGSHDLSTLTTTFFGHAASNMTLDLITFSIAAPLWIYSNAEKKTRLALLGLFVLGAVVNVCSIFRLVSLVDNRAATFPTFDPSWYGSSPIVLSALEVHLATICASLPVFWPIVKDALENKRIIVTREVVVQRESLKLDDFDITDGHDMYSLSTSPSSRPWEHIGNKYRARPRVLSIEKRLSIPESPKISLELPFMRAETPDSATGLTSHAGTTGIGGQGRKELVRHGSNHGNPRGGHLRY